MKIFVKVLYVCISSFYTCLAFAANSDKGGLTIKQTDVLTKPHYNALLYGSLKANQKIKIKKRKRAWYQISSDAYDQGWVKMLNVRLTGIAKRKGELGVDHLVDSITGKLILPTASTGIRGFDEADLKKATANLEQVKKLESFRTTKAQAKEFAKTGNLVPFVTVKREGLTQ